MIEKRENKTTDQEGKIFQKHTKKIKEILLGTLILLTPFTASSQKSYSVMFDSNITIKNMKQGMLDNITSSQNDISIIYDQNYNTEELSTLKTRDICDSLNKQYEDNLDFMALYNNQNGAKQKLFEYIQQLYPNKKFDESLLALEPNVMVTKMTIDKNNYGVVLYPSIEGKYSFIPGRVCNIVVVSKKIMFVIVEKAFDQATIAKTVGDYITLNKGGVKSLLRELVHMKIIDSINEQERKKRVSLIVKQELLHGVVPTQTELMSDYFTFLESQEFFWWRFLRYHASIYKQEVHNIASNIDYLEMFSYMTSALHNMGITNEDLQTKKVDQLILKIGDVNEFYELFMKKLEKYSFACFSDSRTTYANEQIISKLTDKTSSQKLVKNQKIANQYNSLMNQENISQILTIEEINRIKKFLYYKYKKLPLSLQQHDEHSAKNQQITQEERRELSKDIADFLRRQGDIFLLFTQGKGLQAIPSMVENIEHEDLSITHVNTGSIDKTWVLYPDNNTIIYNKVQEEKEFNSFAVDHALLFPDEQCSLQERSALELAVQKFAAQYPGTYPLQRMQHFFRSHKNMAVTLFVREFCRINRHFPAGLMHIDYPGSFFTHSIRSLLETLGINRQKANSIQQLVSQRSDLGKKLNSYLIYQY